MARITHALIDTGPLVAYLSFRDPQHQAVAQTLESFTGQLHTSAAVITEAMHFVARTNRGPELLLRFLTESRTQVHELGGLDSIARTVALMARYDDTPMDFADATLVLLADEMNIHSVFTLDRRGFATFRTPSGRHLEILNPPAAS